MNENHQGLIAEIKLLLQEELALVYKAIHQIDVQITDFKARAVERSELEHIVAEERDRSEKALVFERRRAETALAEERKRREDSDKELNALKIEVSSMKASNKIYLGIAATVTTAILAGIVAILAGLAG
jgi:hypothetical protein